MYHFCLQARRKSTRTTVLDSYDAFDRMASDLFRGARSEYQNLFWHPGVFSGIQDEGRVQG
jgi:hypothetical protein